MANEPKSGVAQEQKPAEQAHVQTPVPLDFKYGFRDWLGLILTGIAAVLLIAARIILGFEPEEYYTIRGVLGIFIIILGAIGACYNFFKGDRRFTVDFWVSTGVLGFSLLMLAF